ncbi:MAG: sarcosine oxidase subunit gamma [Proteobacteria bacterium]|jgi:heterotetrameric sarcosine oxidase gamma subunit|nr:sarcosine oxidase subunit gamma [Pseudomonadota bacterium]HJP06902.1 hypothetical protein [Arenicellales bacterium]|tara:strand:- start:3749 stop:4309 length:561 start_codon:yes stop_codon:yes gene_type:complete
MAERHSPLATHYARGLHGCPGEPGVRLLEVPELTLYQVATWPETLPQAGAFVAQCIGAGVAPASGETVIGTKGSALRVEPLKWWILDTPIPALPAETGATLDLSHSRSRIRVQGSEAATCLNRLAPIDLRDGSFAVGQVASSGIHHVGVTIWRSAAGYELFLPRGFALSLWEILTETAEQFGLEIT